MKHFFLDSIKNHSCFLPAVLSSQCLPGRPPGPGRSNSHSRDYRAESHAVGPQRKSRRLLQEEVGRGKHRFRAVALRHNTLEWNARTGLVRILDSWDASGSQTPYWPSLPKSGRASLDHFQYSECLNTELVWYSGSWL